MLLSLSASALGIAALSLRLSPAVSGVLGAPLYTSSALCADWPAPHCLAAACLCCAPSLISWGLAGLLGCTLSLHLAHLWPLLLGLCWRMLAYLLAGLCSLLCSDGGPAASAMGLGGAAIALCLLSRFALGWRRASLLSPPSLDAGAARSEPIYWLLCSPARRMLLLSLALGCYSRAIAPGSGSARCWLPSLGTGGLPLALGSSAASPHYAALCCLGGSWGRGSWLLSASLCCPGWLLP